MKKLFSIVSTLFACLVFMPQCRMTSRQAVTAELFPIYEGEDRSIDANNRNYGMSVRLVRGIN